MTSAIKWHFIREPVLNVRKLSSYSFLMMAVSVHLSFTFWGAVTENFSLSNYDDESGATSRRSRLSCAPLQQWKLLNQASEWENVSSPGLVTNLWYTGLLGIEVQPWMSSPALTDWLCSFLGTSSNNIDLILLTRLWKCNQQVDFLSSYLRKIFRVVQPMTGSGSFGTTRSFLNKVTHMTIYFSNYQ